MKTKQSIYDQVTESLIEAIEKGCLAWRKPWSASTCNVPLRSCGKPYQGINVVILWVASMAKGLNSPYWMTYNQVQALGGHVRKGEKATTICYYSTFSKNVETESGEVEEKHIPFLKAYRVFNAEQCEKLPEQFYPVVSVNEQESSKRIEEIDAFVSTLGADIRCQNMDRAFYNSRLDLVSVPSILDFVDSEHYYGTLFHEIMHWTGHDTRLGRKLGNSFGSEDYALEELVAELGAAFLCAGFNFGNVTRDDHAAYLQNWLKALKNDKKFIFKASSFAQKAVNYLQGLSRGHMKLAA